MRALAGLLSAGLGVAVAELLAAATRPAAGPLVAVGGAVIDATPTAVKEFAVRELGTHDKPVLLAVIGLVVAALAAVTGIAGGRWRAAVIAGPAILGLAGAAAAVSRPAAQAYDVVPSLAGATLAGVTLWWLLRRHRAPSGVRVDRRRFLRAAALVAGGAVVASGGAVTVRRVAARTRAQARADIRLPVAADPGPPVPPGLVTPNRDFYRVDTALTVPRIDLDGWSLRVRGMVDRELEVSFADLLEMPLIERPITMTCVSNEVGGPYMGTATWLGVPLAPLLRSLGVSSRADQLVARSVDGMTIGTPVATLLDGRDAMLAVGMNGEPLPLEHGFPVRMVTPGLYGYAGSCKWLTSLELTTFDRFDAYWVERGWAAEAPVKTGSRIDKPRPFARLDSGVVTVAGVAWAQQRGIASVEVRVDDGPWAKAELLPAPSVDTWVQWRYSWKAAAGPHSLAVRATDRTGAVQAEERATPFPSGATGWHTISVSVS
ncbi:oxidoreductase [Paractinoplanes abujensis]|uniref:DMSO/TMAO reductase YedYZ molybdopterin-dependent catalytic subunit n=1 Tax=Paractinoplanes abujensis TaxID=882441 RepID=A0A7W7CYI6_9ACTN|nr:molybdopterin-dependent oxidoreductase [Actinoplanes abujensis]MBB4697034.1 DMSO/TMAO reductase YedYZ molybdopterin-dependent catalytic subunit [Actinoplanes abujensis]GID18493.1 oxidoreductase [Actinoplanes abujensis]